MDEQTKFSCVDDSCYLAVSHSVTQYLHVECSLLSMSRSRNPTRQQYIYYHGHAHTWQWSESTWWTRGVRWLSSWTVYS